MLYHSFFAFTSVLLASLNPSALVTQVKCSFEAPDGCDEKETAFMAKWKDKPKDEVAAQLKRLEVIVDAPRAYTVYA